MGKRLFILLAAAVLLLASCEKEPTPPQVGLNGYDAVIVVVNNARWDVTVDVEDHFFQHFFLEVPAHSTSEPMNIIDGITQMGFDHGVPVYIRMWDGDAVTTHTLFSEEVFFAEQTTTTFTINEDYSVNLEQERYY